MTDVPTYIVRGEDNDWVEPPETNWWVCRDGKNVALGLSKEDADSIAAGLNRLLDLEAAASEAVTEDFLEELAAAFFADWHAGVLGWNEAGDDNRAMMLQHAETAAAKFKPLLAAVRRDALDEAARAADRSRTRGEAVRAIRALGRPA